MQLIVLKSAGTSDIFRDISAALDGLLNGMTGLPPVAWENDSYEPVIGTLFVRPTNIQGKTVADTEQDKTIGVYQIDVFGADGEGKAEIVAMGDTLVNRFKQGELVPYNGNTVVVKNSSRGVLSNVDNGWCRVMVDVDYYCFSDRR